MKKRLVVKLVGSGPFMNHDSLEFTVPENSMFVIIHGYPRLPICHGLGFLITPGLIYVYPCKWVTQVFRLPRISDYPFPVTPLPGFSYSEPRVSLPMFRRSAGSLRAVCQQRRQAPFFMNWGSLLAGCPYAANCRQTARRLLARRYLPAACAQSARRLRAEHFRRRPRFESCAVS